MKYKKRIVDQEFERKLESAGAVLIRGPKACGKTASAKQQCKSVLQVDQDVNVPILMDTAPNRLLKGEAPLLIDEWQFQPKLWDYIRHEVDNRQLTGQFILTGSAQPEEHAKMHSGAGRFAIVDMRTMSWQELDDSSGLIRLSDLLQNCELDATDNPVGLDKIIERIVKGGFPGLMDKKLNQAKDINRSYIQLLAEVDMSRVSNTKRDPYKVKAVLKSLARNTATMAEITTIEKDVREKDAIGISRTTVYDYLDVLQRQMILEDQPAWNVHMRSSHSLRKTPKRHFADVSLAVAALGADEDWLIKDLNFTGFLFESMVVHDLRIYAQANDARVFHYHDASGLEVDAIVQKANGDWSAFEIKLGTAQLDEAAQNLLSFQSKIDLTKQPAPKSLNIITGTGISHKRKDGVNVISIGSLGF